jgi:hypothetical protein
VLAALIVGGCAGATRSSAAGSSPSSSPPASTLIVTTSPSAVPSSAAPSSAAPSSSAASAESPSESTEPCVVERQTGVLPSDRFTAVTVTTGSDADLVTFTFGDPSLPGPPAPPTGTLETAVPPFTEAGSGKAIDLEGDHVLQVRFTGMSIQNDVGQPVYEGDPEYRPEGQALRHLVLFDMSEGVVGWYIGHDGPGCVTLTRVGDSVTVRIAHD